MREATSSALTDVVVSDAEGELEVDDPGLEELTGPSTLTWNSLEAAVGDAEPVVGFVKLEAVGVTSWAAADGVAEPVMVTVVVRVVVEVTTPGDSTAANSCAFAGWSLGTNTRVRLPNVPALSSRSTLSVPAALASLEVELFLSAVRLSEKGRTIPVFLSYSKS